MRNKVKVFMAAAVAASLGMSTLSFAAPSPKAKVGATNGNDITTFEQYRTQLEIRTPGEESVGSFYVEDDDESSSKKAEKAEAIEAIEAAGVEVVTSSLAGQGVGFTAFTTAEMSTEYLAAIEAAAPTVAVAVDGSTTYITPANVNDVASMNEAALKTFGNDLLLAGAGTVASNSDTVAYVSFPMVEKGGWYVVCRRNPITGQDLKPVIVTQAERDGVLNLALSTGSCEFAVYAVPEAVAKAAMTAPSL